MTPLQEHLSHQSDAAKLAFLTWFLEMTPAQRVVCERFPPGTRITVNDAVYYAMGYPTTNDPCHAHLKVAPRPPENAADFERLEAEAIVLCPDAIKSWTAAELN
jgi:hypothetical protein